MIDGESGVRLICQTQFVPTGLSAAWANLAKLRVMQRWGQRGDSS